MQMGPVLRAVREENIIFQNIMVLIIYAYLILPGVYTWI